jgi:hypothetical protein
VDASLAEAQGVASEDSVLPEAGASMLDTRAKVTARPSAANCESGETQSHLIQKWVKGSVCTVSTRQYKRRSTK